MIDLFKKNKPIDIISNDYIVIRSNEGIELLTRTQHMALMEKVLPI